MTDTPFLAHSENDAGEVHRLRDHLLDTKKMISTYAVAKVQASLLALAALLHDFGKYRLEFLNYLRNGGVRGSVPHARWGAIIARGIGAHEISYAIDGHHAGLPDQAKWEHEHTFADAQELRECRLLLERFLKDTETAEKELLSIPRIDLPPLERDILTRFIFSCLVDADWLDTEAHFDPQKSSLRERRILSSKTICGLLAMLEAEFLRLGNDKTSHGINELRNAVRMQALQKTKLPAGFFSLNLPTGLGKTLTSLHWALEHAAANNLERIIIVLPYVNIIDQTASKLKEIFGEDLILEHHSGYVPATGNSIDAQEHELEDRKKLACENWDYEVIVTSNVQFYETLFSNAPSKCRKFHNIANSVVILDEVQTLNKDLVLPTLDMLQNIQDVLNTSFVFCTATMPAFEKREGFSGVARITPLVDDPECLFEKTIRVRFEQLGALMPISLDELQASLQASTVSTLAILNTKHPVNELYLMLKTSNQWDKIIYLTTNLCPHHRKNIISDINVMLKGKQKLLVLSTQLVEAGVDFDFPCVFREIAPLESIIQASGRCNREGKMEEPGRVVLFQLANAKSPDRFYKSQAQHVYNLLASGTGDLYDYDFFQTYYKQILNLFVAQKQTITEGRAKSNFMQVSEQYRLIPDNTRPIFIYGYNDESRKLYNRLKMKEKLALKLSREDHRQLQQYSVQVFENFFRNTKGLWEELPCGVRVWNGRYDGGLGLDIGIQHTDALIM